MEEDVQRNAKGEIIPTALSIGGGILGGIATRNPRGAMAGASLGGALGEAIQQKLEIKGGLRKNINTGQVAAQGIISGATEGLGQGTNYAWKLAKPSFVRLVSKISGYNEAVVNKALLRTPGAVLGTKLGETELGAVVKRTALGIQKKANELLEISKNKVNDLQKQLLGGTRYTNPNERLFARQTVEANNFINKTAGTLRKEFNIGTETGGKLNFNRSDLPSNIVSGGDKGTIQDAWSTIRTVFNNISIKHLDAVNERLLILRSKTPVGSPTGAETRRIIGKMIDELHDFVRNLPPSKYGPVYKDYGDFLSQMAPQRAAINDAKEIFGYGTLSTKEVTQKTGVLLNLYETGKLETRKLAETVGTQVGEDIAGTSAGTLLTIGQPAVPGIQTRNLARGLFERLFEAIPRSVVKEYVRTGNIANPYIQNIINVTKIPAKALRQEFINLMANKTTD